MNQDMWSKSLLASYNYLPTIANCIERGNMQMALGSFSYQGNALDLMEKMIENNKRKRRLINAKIIVDTTLELLSEKNREVLKLRYFKRKSFEQIAEILNICLRSVFRWHDNAIKQFSSICVLRGYDEEWMNDNYAQDGLFEKCAIRCRQEENKKQEKSQKNKTVKSIGTKAIKSKNDDLQIVVANANLTKEHRNPIKIAQRMVATSTALKKAN